MTKPQNIRIPHSVWRPGDVVLDAEGNLRVRSDSVHWPWASPDDGETRKLAGGAYVPDGEMGELDPIRPLKLLVRDGYAVAGHVFSEEPPAAQDIGSEVKFRMDGVVYRVMSREGSAWRCRGTNRVEVVMSSEDIAAWKAKEYGKPSVEA
ncbi:hypothetical protein ACIQY8_24200 [Streptomyces albidoflavus]